jgi:predicted double-glycine peptidase
LALTVSLKDSELKIKVSYMHLLKFISVSTLSGMLGLSILGASVNSLAQTKSSVPTTVHDIKMHKEAAEYFEGIVPQSKTTTCGAAALATLMTYHMSMPVTEKELLKSVANDGSRLSSAYEITQMAQSKGIRLKALRASKETLLPAIVRVIHPAIYADVKEGRPVKKMLHHFVVLTKIEDDKFYLKDPAYGNSWVTRSEFMRMWLDPNLSVDSASKNGNFGVVISAFNGEGKS